MKTRAAASPTLPPRSARLLPGPELWLAAALGIWCLAVLLPTAEGLTPTGQAVLGVAVAGTILWVSEAVPLGVTGLLVLTLLGLSPDITPGRVFSGFASEVVFFLIGAVALGAAVEVSGLAGRMARWLARGAGGSPLRLYAQMIVGLPVFAFLVPSAITRNAILIPAYREALTAMGLERSQRTGRALMLALGVLNPLASSALLTGGISSMTAATLIGGFSWLGWFALMAVPYYALILLGAAVLVVIVGGIEPKAAGQDLAYERTPFTGTEIRTLLVLAVTLLLWLTDAWHHLSPAIPAIIAGCLLLSPSLGVLTWKAFEQRLSWALILTVGCSMSLARAMTESGAAAWLGDRLLQFAGEASSEPVVVVSVLVLVSALLHLAVTNLAACIALLIPIATTVAYNAGLNPVLLSLIVTIVVDAVILYPVQTAANLLAYDSGYFSATDLRRFGIAMLVLTLLVIIGCLPYWSAMGLRL